MEIFHQDLGFWQADKRNKTVKTINLGKVSLPYHSVCPLLYLWFQGKWWKSMQLLCKPHLFYYCSHRSTPGSASASYILHRSQSVQRWQWCNVIILLGKKRDADQKHRLHKQDEMIYSLWPMHLLAFKIISVAEFPLVRKIGKYKNNTNATFLSPANKLISAQCTDIGFIR